MNLSFFISFVGGIGLFVYGMHTLADGLQKVAGDKMKNLLEVLTRNKLMGVLVGCFVTAIIQSSSATTVMVVGFVNAQIMGLSQAVGVIMGANIGTTITSVIIAMGEISETFGAGAGSVGVLADIFDPIFMAPAFVGLGSFMILLSSKNKVKDWGSVIAGFGMIFVGMSQMSSSVKPLTESPLITEIFVTFGKNPVLGILAGAVVTSILQSSSATIGILQALSATGLVPFSSAVYLILGQNIGTCITAILSSIGASKNAKSVAYMHLLFNVIGSIIFSVLAVIYFTFFNKELAESSIGLIGISTVHVLYNFATTVILYPFSDYLIKGAEFMSNKFALGKKEGLTADKKDVHLDDRVLENPSFAIQSCIIEIIRMGNKSLESLKLAAAALLESDEEKIPQVFKNEKIVDDLEEDIQDYLVKITKTSLSEKEYDLVASLLRVTNDIERVSDHCENIVEIATSLIDEEVKLSEDSLKALKEIVDTVIVCYETSIQSLEDDSVDKAKEVIIYEEKVDDLEKDLRAGHLKRLARGEYSSEESGVAFLDALINFERISDHALNIAQAVMKSEA